MMYIIHLLLECDEFESLVHPKVDKVIDGYCFRNYNTVCACVCVSMVPCSLNVSMPE